MVTTDEKANKVADEVIGTPSAEIGMDESTISDAGANETVQKASLGTAAAIDKQEDGPVGPKVDTPKVSATVTKGASRKGLSRYSSANTVVGARRIPGAVRSKRGLSVSTPPGSSDFGLPSSKQENRSIDSGLDNAIQPTRIKGGLSQGSPAGSADSELQNAKRQVRSTDSGVEIARQPMRSKMFLSQNPTPESADFGLEKGQQEPSYIRYVSADAADEKAKYAGGNTPVPGYIGYIDGTSKHRSSGGIDKIHIRQFPRTVSVDQLQRNIASFPTETESGVAAGTPQLRRGPGVENPPEPGAYPGGIDMVDVDDWLEDGYLDREPTEELSPQVAQPQPQPSMDTDGLAVAKPVSQQFSADLGEAKHVDLALVEERRQKQKKRSRMLLLTMVMIGCALLVGIILLLVFMIGPEKSNSYSVTQEERNNTQVPISKEESFYALLPSQTVNAIHEDQFSPQAQAFNWTLEDPNFSAFQDWRKVQRFALATFFFATGGELEGGETKGKWLTRRHWLSYDHNECEWFASNHVGPPNQETEAYGLVASYPPLIYNSGLCPTNETSNGKVERLVFFGNGLEGYLPPELSLLTKLRALATVNNPMAGTIPTEIGLLTKLEVFVSVVQGMEGSLPSELSNARNLTHLLFYQNKLTGSIPTELGMLTNLKGLMVDKNKIDGTLPTELGLLTNVVWISGYKTLLTGTIPTELGNLSSLRFLAIFDNFFQGTFPSELGLLSSIQELNIQSGILNGTLPTEVAQLHKLEKLYLVNNDFRGQIPSELGLLQNLWYINLGHSDFTGTFPLELLLAKSMKVLYLYNNKISGPIPTEIGLASGLKQFAVQGNDLTGPIPSQAGLLTMLDIFNLNFNKISGTIPRELHSLGTLQSLGLLDKGNNTLLSGALPREICASIRDKILINCDNVECPDNCDCQCDGLEQICTCRRKNRLLMVP